MFAIDIHEWGLGDIMSENRARANKIPSSLHNTSRSE
jgi:hypothetical protein